MEGVHEETPHVVPCQHHPHTTSAHNNCSTTQRRQRQPLVALVGVLHSTQLSLLKQAWTHRLPAPHGHIEQ